jgi:hypothetical protein
VVPILDPQVAIDTAEVIKKYLKIIDSHIHTYETESYIQGTIQEFRTFEEEYFKLQQRLDQSIRSNLIITYDKIKQDAIALKNRLDNSQLFRNVSKHWMYLSLADEYDSRIEFNIQVRKFAAKEIKKASDVFEDRIRLDDQKISKQAAEKEGLHAQILQLQAQNAHLTSKLIDSHKSNEELREGE